MKHIPFAVFFFFTMNFATMFLLNGCVTPHTNSPKKAAELVFPAQNLKVDAFWQTTPATEAEQFLRLEVRDQKTGELVNPPSGISVSVWMKTHSYGLVEPTVSRAIDAQGKDIVGVYNVSGIYFLASGKWEVQVYLNEQTNPKPMQKFVVDLGEETLNPINDPKSPMHQMMNKPGGMDHSKHMEMMKDKSKKDAKPGS